MFHPIAVWEDPADDERVIAANRAFAEAMRPFEHRAAPTSTSRQRTTGSATPTAPSKYERLVALKDKYDPENLFRRNQNIEPSAKAGAAA